MPSLVPPRDRCHQVGLLPKHLMHLNRVDIYIHTYVDICGYMRYIHIGIWWVLLRQKKQVMWIISAWKCVKKKCQLNRIWKCMAFVSWTYVDLWHLAGEYVDYLAAKPAPAPSTTAPPPQLSSPHHPGAHFSSSEFQFSCPNLSITQVHILYVQQLSSEILIMIGE